MLIEREPLRVESDAFVHLQRRHPLRNIPIDGKRQAEEIIHLFLVGEVDAGDVHKINVGADRDPPQQGITWIWRVLPFDRADVWCLCRW